MSRITFRLKPVFFALIGFFAAVGVLSFSHVGPAQAQTPGVNLAQIVATVNALKAQQATDEQTITSQGNTIASLQGTVSALKSQQSTDEDMITYQGKYVFSLVNSVSVVQSKQTADESNIATNTNNIGKLQTLTAPFALSSDPNAGGTNTLLTITGVNVQIINGQGSTETQNGLGNLIVGYNEKDPQFTQARTGSHNLVVGMDHNYLSYGGFVAGEDNDISGPFATVTGGYLNIASSGHASVSGGSGNTANGGSASISGGQNNKASGSYASVSGGSGNTASGYHASVSGGQSNTASGSAAAVSGGQLNTAGGANSSSRADATSVSGGSSLTESSGLGWKAGSESGFTFSAEGNFESD